MSAHAKSFRWAVRLAVLVIGLLPATGPVQADEKPDRDAVNPLALDEKVSKADSASDDAASSRRMERARDDDERRGGRRWYGNNKPGDDAPRWKSPDQWFAELPPLPFDTGDYEAIVRFAEEMEHLRERVEDGRKSLRRGARGDDDRASEPGTLTPKLHQGDEAQQRELHRRALALREDDIKLRRMFFQALRQSPELAATVRARIDRGNFASPQERERAEKLFAKLSKASEHLERWRSAAPPPPHGPPGTGSPLGVPPLHPEFGQGPPPPGPQGMPPDMRPDAAMRSPDGPPPSGPPAIPFRDLPGFRMRQRDGLGDESTAPAVAPADAQRLERLRRENEAQRRQIRRLEERLERLEALLLELDIEPAASPSPDAE